MIKKVNISDMDIETLRKIGLDSKSQEDDFFDYSKVVVRKPWGYEYLIYQNDLVAVWILHIKRGFQTSMHCHPNKKTSLVVLSGKAKCSILHKDTEVEAGDGLLIDKGVFHSTESLSEEGIFVMEIETPVNKRDLVRFKDKYGREGKGYENISNISYNLFNYNYISLIEPYVFYNMKKKFGKCSISLARYRDPEDLKKNLKLEGWDAVSILKGRILTENKDIILDAGDTVDLEMIKLYLNIIIFENEIEVITIKKNDKMIKVSDYIASFFEKENITDIFLVPGSSNLHLLDSIGRNTHLQHISTQTEQAAILAAEGYAKATGNLGVTIIPSGYSSANVIGGVADAWVDSTPLLIITGQAQSDQSIGNSNLRQLGIQELDIINMVKKITKYAIKIENPYLMRYHLEKAVFLAQLGRPGPAWLDIPTDILGMMINEEEFIHFNHLELKENNEVIAKSQIDRIFTLLNNAQRPIILAGNGIRLAKAESEFFTLINLLGIPVLTSRRGADLLADDHHLYFGRPGAYGQRSANFMIQNADLLISIGSRLSLPQIGRNHSAFARAAKKIVIDIDKEELEKKTINPDIKINCSAKFFINDMIKNIASYNKPLIIDWLEKCNAWKEKYSKEKTSLTNETINAYFFFEVISNLLKEGTNIVIDSGSPMIFAMQEFKFKLNQRLISATGLENTSFSLPASIGACIGKKGQEVICICEDHGFQKNSQELETISTYNLPIKIFILNNKGYSYIKKIQNNYFGSRYVASDRNSNINKIGDAYGIPTYTIENSIQLGESIRKVLDAKGAAIGIINIDPNQEIVPRITFTVKSDGKWLAKPLEDMYPIMDREEFKKNMIIKTMDEKYYDEN